MESYHDGVDLFDADLWCNEAKVNVVNDTAVQMVEEIGGRSALSALDDETFEEAKKKVLDAVRGKLAELRPKLESLCWDKMMETRRREKFEELWSQCKGDGVMGASCFEDCQMAIVRTTPALGWLLQGTFYDYDETGTLAEHYRSMLRHP